MEKRLLVFITVFILFFSFVFTQGVSADIYRTEGKLFEKIDSAGSYFSPGSVTYNESYYEQLNAEQKNFYQELSVLKARDNHSISVEPISAITFTSITKNPTEQETVSVFETISDIVIPAFIAYLYDNPIVFWYNNNSEFGMSYDGYNIGGVWQWEVEAIDLNLTVSDTYKPDTESYFNQTLNAIGSFNTTATTRYEILKDIHDYLCENVIYVLNGEYAHEPYGALVEGEAVCEGYAKAFKLLCDKYDIPCALIIGEGITDSGSEPHMWNYVQMQDGKWYGVDVTWDDQSIIYYDFFLSGSETVAENFGTGAFMDSHIEDALFYYGAITEFAFPMLSSTAYSFGGDDATIKNDSGLSFCDNYLYGIKDMVSVEKLKEKFIGDIDVFSDEGVLLSDVDFVGTGCTVDIGSNSYTVIIKGDINGDGQIRANDYVLLKRIIIGSYTANDVEIKAGCVGGTEFPRSVDYLIIKRHIIGSYDMFE